MLTDTHCHLDLEKFDSDRDAVIERAARAGVEHILIPGLNVASSHSVVKLAESHPILFAAVGVHPTEASTWGPATAGELHAIITTASGVSGSSAISGSLKTSPTPGTSATSRASSPSKILAIGEIGLDYYWDSAPHEMQKKVLQEQLDLASEAGLPVILHMREAKDAPGGNCASDLLKILGEWVESLRSKNNPLAEKPGVLHSFSGTLETARRAMGLGFYIGVTGPVTFRNARIRQEVVAALPLDRLLIETDAPFQAPHPYRGKRNEPAYVGLIADKIGLLHSRSSEAIAAATSENALRLFNWE